MSRSRTEACSHPDIHKFDGMRCCLSCGFTLFDHDSTLPDDGKASFDQDLDVKSEARLYRYRRLNHELGREIRLLRLLPGFSDEVLRCSIQHVNLDDNPNYEAVSYTWAGQDGRTRMNGQILCQNNTYLEISENCEAVLRRIRGKGHARSLWIDMVCIDQQHLAERNHQVNMMDRIYRQAQLVIVDLGDGTKSSEAIFNKIKAPSCNPRPTRAQFQDFFFRRWFQRGWVLQEVALAKCAIVHCGQSTVNWYNLQSFIWANYRNGSMPPALQLDFRWSSHMDVSSLIDTLGTTISCGVADPRDKIYSLLGLCHPDLRQQLPVDYTLTLSQVYMELVALYIFQTGSWLSKAFVFAFSDLQSVELGPVPSWFPTSMQVHNEFHDLVPPSLDCCSDRHHVQRDLIQLRSGLLKVSARFLGHIQFLRDVRSHPLTYEEGHLPIWRFIESQSMWQQVRADTMAQPTAKRTLLQDEISPKYDQLVRAASEEQVRQLETERAIVSYKLYESNDPSHHCEGESSDLTMGTSTEQTILPYAEADITNAVTNDQRLDVQYLVDPTELHTVDHFSYISSHHEKATLKHVLFGTKHCLGYALEKIRVGDSLWILEERRQVFVLRHCPQDRPVSVIDTAKTIVPSPGQHRYKILTTCYYYSQATIYGAEEGQNSKDGWQEIDLI